MGFEFGLDKLGRDQRREIFQVLGGSACMDRVYFTYHSSGRLAIDGGKSAGVLTIEVPKFELRIDGELVGEIEL